MQQIGCKVFSYPAWRPWTRLASVVVAATLLILYLMFMSREQIAYWLLLVGLVALVVLGIRHFALAFTEPNIIIVTDDGITAKRLHGATLHISWADLPSVRESTDMDSYGFARRAHVLRVRARDGRTLILFDSDLPGYKELREIVLWHTESRKKYETPVIVDENGDVLIFRSLSEAEGYLEAIDVINNEYRAAYDSLGHLLHLTAHGDIVRIELAEAEPNHTNELRNALTLKLKGLGVPIEWLAQASLEELVERALPYAIR